MLLRRVLIFFFKQVVNLDELKSQNSLSCFRGSLPFSSVLWAHACMAGELASDLGRASRIRCFLCPWHFLFLYFLHLTFCQPRLPHTLYFSCSSQQDYWFYLIILTVLHGADGPAPRIKPLKHETLTQSYSFLPGVGVPPVLASFG